MPSPAGRLGAVLGSVRRRRKGNNPWAEVRVGQSDVGYALLTGGDVAATGGFAEEVVETCAPLARIPPPLA